MLNETQVNNRVAWVKDLLSGNFKQGKRALKIRDEDGSFTYCCLGVACERFAPTSDNLKVSNSGYSNEYMADRTAMNKLGLTEDDQTEAGRWNDERRFTFSRIADLVAFATDNDKPFADVTHALYHVPEGFAVEWLGQFD